MGIKLKTWDNMIIPLPFSKVIVKVLDPIKIVDIKSENDEALQRALSSSDFKIDSI